jgi:hypothetical protein
MLRSSTIIIIHFFLWLISSSFVSDNSINIPIKKIEKSIEKIWNTDNHKIIELQKNSCLVNGKLFKIESSDIKIGFVYIGRVFSCRHGGCSVNSSDENLSFEYFDYYMLLDTDNQVVWTKVFNYQASYGHEIMSRGWLNQFNGIKQGDSLEFGRDIEAISGATISASAITDDIQQVLSCL